MLKQQIHINDCRAWCLWRLFSVSVTACNKLGREKARIAGLIGGVTKSVTLLLFSPATQAEPDDRPGGGNEQSLDGFDVAVSEQVPGHDTNENANSFGDRKSRVWC